MQCNGATCITNVINVWMCACVCVSLHTHIYIYIHIYTYAVYIYIYIEREIEREKERNYVARIYVLRYSLDPAISVGSSQKMLGECYAN